MKKKTTKKLVTYYCAVEKTPHDDTEYDCKVRYCTRFYKNKFLAMHEAERYFMDKTFKIISHRFNE